VNNHPASNQHQVQFRLELRGHKGLSMSY